MGLRLGVGSGKGENAELPSVGVELKESLLPESRRQREGYNVSLAPSS